MFAYISEYDHVIQGRLVDPKKKEGEKVKLIYLGWENLKIKCDIQIITNQYYATKNKKKKEIELSLK